MKLNVQMNDRFFIPINNLYLDESLKLLKANEFKTYMAITYIVKKIGPNTKLYYSNKREIYQDISKLINVSKQTFLKHLKTFEAMGLIEFERSNSLNIGYNISDSKSYGFTPVDINELKYLITNLDQNELKLYMALYRILRGFNQEKGTYTYSQLKTWSGIKNKAIFISTRNSLVEKKLISALFDLDKNTFTFKLSEIKLDQIPSISKKGLDKELHDTEKKPSNCGFGTKKKPHIKRSSTFLNKYFKKSCGESSKIDYENKAQSFQKENKNKIFKFLSENIQTSHLPEDEKLELVEKLINEVKQNGGFKGVKIKSTADYYLAQEHETFGRNLDKIVSRYFENIEQTKRDHEACDQFLLIANKYYPEEVRNLDDFKTNDISYHKLGKLIKKSPILLFWSDKFIMENTQIKNPKFDLNQANKSNKLMEKLIFEEIGETDISFEKRMELIAKFLPEVEKVYPVEDEFINVSCRIKFSKFLSKYLN